ncbi:hypothetical protein GOP47_0009690 [Adiantum capillus-veneris]|uniref:Uncharacterized protein n=1 Tax=Adiantum capillus-veneris TaxID=13818 RepID=A0A9D4UXB3_ADICA|nr:hypothetical protein GOP47_0009690 [Adiantum capillus-veneris]
MANTRQGDTAQRAQRPWPCVSLSSSLKAKIGGGKSSSCKVQRYLSLRESPSESLKDYAWIWSSNETKGEGPHTTSHQLDKGRRPLRFYYKSSAYMAYCSLEEFGEENDS